MPKFIFDYGETVRARNTYTDPADGTPVDPIGVSVEVRKPDLTTEVFVYGTDVELTKPSVGIYQVLISLDTTGTYKWKWTATTANGSVVDYDECDSERKF
jgi:hypothetical protein